MLYDGFSKYHVYRSVRKVYTHIGVQKYYAEKRANAFVAQACLLEGIPYSMNMRGYISLDSIKRTADRMLNSRYHRLLMSYLRR